MAEKPRAEQDPDPSAQCSHSLSLPEAARQLLQCSSLDLEYIDCYIFQEGEAKPVHTRIYRE